MNLKLFFRLLGAPGQANRKASYAWHIHPLFTAKQIQCMTFMLQLDSYEDVKGNAEAIYTRLADKSMPMDETKPWPDEWISLFRRWIDEGCAP
ncbi:hypothetical protein [Bradyrhizobium sp. RT11b]|uniref:hypothetical protein n=1 Tax=Bradyrhizobium sp. RT11b TaxID=3156332 RepID=UPI00339B027B